MKISNVECGNAKVDISIDEKGINEVVLTPEEIADETLLLGAECTSQINGLISKTREEMFNSLQENLKSAVMNILGFEKSWHADKWSIDHTNRRNSFISGHIAADVEDFIKKTTIDDLELTQEDVNDLTRAVLKDWKDRYKESIKSLTRKYMDEVLENQVKIAFESEFKKVVDVEAIAKEMVQDLVINK